MRPRKSPDELPAGHLISGPFHVKDNTPIARIDHPLWVRRIGSETVSHIPLHDAMSGALCTGSRHSPANNQRSNRPIPVSRETRVCHREHRLPHLGSRAVGLQSDPPTGLPCTGLRACRFLFACSRARMYMVPVRSRRSLYDESVVHRSTPVSRETWSVIAHHRESPRRERRPHGAPSDLPLRDAIHVRSTHRDPRSLEALTRRASSRSPINTRFT